MRQILIIAEFSVAIGIGYLYGTYKNRISLPYGETPKYEIMSRQSKFLEIDNKIDENNWLMANTLMR